MKYERLYVIGQLDSNECHIRVGISEKGLVYLYHSQNDVFTVVNGVKCNTDNILFIPTEHDASSILWVPTDCEIPTDTWLSPEDKQNLQMLCDTYLIKYGIKECMEFSWVVLYFLLSNIFPWLFITKPQNFGVGLLIFFTIFIGSMAVFSVLLDILGYTNYGANALPPMFTLHTIRRDSNANSSRQ